MNVNKKLGRLKQWAGERMGGEIRTNVSDDFKDMELEMALRFEGMEKMQRSMNAYMKAISKRSEEDRKEKTLPIAFLGSTMVSHGEDFDVDSEIGQCLNMFGRTQERLARAQETYIADATTSWLESLDRSLIQHKELQIARKKLETRRLAYDTSLAKAQKAKREDFRFEEELRSNRAKYEEIEDDVFRRMEELKNGEAETVVDLGSFMEAELAYHESARQALLQLRNEWPAGASQASGRPRPTPRSRSNTTRSYLDRFDAVEEEAPALPTRPSIKSSRTASLRMPEPPARDTTETATARPSIGRSTTFEGPTRIRGDSSSSAVAPPMTRLPSDSLAIRTTRSQLRNVDPAGSENDIFQDDSPSYGTSSPDHSYGERSASPATSLGSSVAPLTSTISKGPAPSVPLRSKKPPPPPPPPKRTIIT